MSCGPCVRVLSGAVWEVWFFFSSRRRHTRWTGDWSSDVCSSDLGLAAGSTAARRQLGRVEQTLLVRRVVSGAQLSGYTRSAAHAGFAESLERTLDELDEGLLSPDAVEGEIGRASCRGRGERWGVA